ncbi:MAG: PAS domain S-box protein [Desulfovibrio sp.]
MTNDSRIEIILRRLAPYLLMLCGVVLCAMIFSLVKRNDSNVLQERIQWQVEQRSRAVQSAYDQAFLYMAGVQGVFENLPHVSESQFLALVNPLVSQYPSIESVQWIERTYGSNQGEFSISEYSPAYVFPSSLKSLTTLKFTNREPLKNLLQDVQKTGAPAIVGSWRLMGNSSTEKLFMTVIPVYRTGEADPNRSTSPMGFLLYEINAQELVRDVLVPYDNFGIMTIVSYEDSLNDSSILYSTIPGATLSSDVVPYFSSDKITLHGLPLWVFNGGGKDFLRQHSGKTSWLIYLVFGFSFLLCAAGWRFYELKVRKTTALLNDYKAQAVSDGELQTATLHSRDMIMDSADSAIIIHKMDGTILYVNQKMLDLYDLTHQQALELNAIRDFSVRSRLDKVLAVWKKLKLGEEYRFEWWVETPFSGRRFYAETCANKIMFEQEVVILATIRDITQRKRSEEELAYREEMYRSMFENNVAVMMLIDLDSGRVVSVNNAAQEFYGFSPEEFKELDFTDLNGMSLENALTMLQKLAQTGGKHFSQPHKLASGVVRHVDMYTGPIEFFGRRLVFAIVHDVTTRKMMEQQLEESERRFRDISEAAGEIVWEVDHEMRFTYVTDNVESVLGYKAPEMLGKAIRELVPVVRREKTETWLKKARNERKPFTDVESIFLGKSGARVWLRLSAVPNFTEEGEFSGFRGDCVDITEKKESDEKLQAQRERFRTMLGVLPELIALKDDNFVYQEVNNALCEFFGFKEEGIVGKTDFEMFPPMEARKVRSDDIEILSSGRSLVREAELQGKFAKRWFQISKTPVLNAQGDPSAILYTFQDITRHKELEKTLVAAKVEADVASRLKSQFLVNMSHELRTPMNAIIGLTDLALIQENEKELPDYLQKIRHSARALLRLISDVLDLSRLDAGSFQPELAPFNIKDVVSSVVHDISARDTSQGITVGYAIDPNIPDLVMGDAGLVRRVLYSLMDNGIKFSSEGDLLDVDVSLAGTSDHLFLVSFAVTDTGSGIPSELQSTLFQPFTQADGSSTRRFGGIGLGLSLSRKLVEESGGTLNLDWSEVGKGSRFLITLPFRKVKAAVDEGSKQQPQSLGTELFQAAEDKNHEEVADSIMKKSPIDGAFLLLVEDNPLNQQVAREMLQIKGAVVEIANNGLEAVELVQKNTYDAVLMDIQMAVMDGFEATKRIRKDLGYKELPIIAMTANVLPEDKDECIQAGMDDFLPKPIDLEKLVAILERWLSGEGGAVVEEPAISSDIFTILDDDEQIDFDDVLRRLGGSEQAVFNVIKQFSMEYESAAKEIRDVAESGDIGQAGILAHTLKGVAANIGAMHLRSVAYSLEQALKSGKGDNFEFLFEQLEEKLLLALETARQYLAENEVEEPEADEQSDSDGFNRRRVIEEMQTLHRMIVNHDFATGDFFSKLKGSIRSFVHQDMIDALDKALTQFDFIKSDEILHEIADTLNIEINKE